MKNFLICLTIFVTGCAKHSNPETTHSEQSENSVFESEGGEFLFDNEISWEKVRKNDFSCPFSGSFDPSLKKGQKFVYTHTSKDIQVVTESLTVISLESLNTDTSITFKRDYEMIDLRTDKVIKDSIDYTSVFSKNGLVDYGNPDPLKSVFAKISEGCELTKDDKDSIESTYSKGVWKTEEGLEINALSDSSTTIFIENCKNGTERRLKFQAEVISSMEFVLTNPYLCTPRVIFSKTTITDEDEKVLLTKITKLTKAPMR